MFHSSIGKVGPEDIDTGIKSPPTSQTNHGNRVQIHFHPSPTLQASGSLAHGQIGQGVQPRPQAGPTLREPTEQPWLHHPRLPGGPRPAHPGIIGGANWPLFFGKCGRAAAWFSHPNSHVSFIYWQGCRRRYRYGGNPNTH